jgi:hypothetical protein
MAGKWDNYEALTRKQETGLATETAANALTPISEQIEEIRRQEMDLIGSYQRRKIERKAAIEKLRLMHDASLEAAKHALTRAVDVERERVGFPTSVGSTFPFGLNYLRIVVGTYEDDNNEWHGFTATPNF